MAQQEQAYRQENFAQEGKKYKSLVFRVGKGPTDVRQDKTDILKEEAKRERDRKIFLPLQFFQY